MSWSVPVPTGRSSGVAWDDDAAVVRFAEPVDPGEIQFQPGIFLVRAGVAKELANRRRAAEPAGTLPGGSGHPQPAQPSEPRVPDAGSRDARPARTVQRVTVEISDVPASKARDVVKIAVLPLAAVSSELTVDVRITADGGMGGIPRDTLNLVVAEGLRQLGLTAQINESE